MILRTNFFLLFICKFPFPSLMSPLPSVLLLFFHRASSTPTPMPDCGEIFVTDKTDVTCGSTGTNTIEFSNSDYYQSDILSSSLLAKIFWSSSCSQPINHRCGPGAKSDMCRQDKLWNIYGAVRIFVDFPVINSCLVFTQAVNWRLFRCFIWHGRTLQRCFMS